MELCGKTNNKGASDKMNEGGSKMDGSNLLSGGVDTLNEIKENLLELHGYQANNNSFVQEEEKLEKSIKGLERSISEEIESTIKKRRGEIEDTFDKQMDKTRNRMKKMKEKRDKRKNAKVSERIAEETSSLRSENNRLKLEAKSVFESKRIPGFCNTKLYYSLYAPSCFTDFLISLTVIVIILLLIPCGIYFWVLPEKKILYLIITYVATVLLFWGIYVMIGNRTKEKYLNEILKVKDIRSNIRGNKKKIAVIKNNIRKDRDESSYGLQSFDEELAKLDQEAADIAVQKKDALEAFDNTTAQIIESEIRSSYEDKLSVMKTEYYKTCGQSKKTEDMIKALSIKIASEYELFIGKDLMSLERLDSLINIIQAGSAATISEAITFYRQNMNLTQQ
jgi:hypothetical protein